MSTTGDNSPPVLRHDDGPVAVLTLNRPAARNSLSRGMLRRAAGDAGHRRRRSTASAPS